MKNYLVTLSLTLFALSSSAAPPTDESIRTLFAVMKAESMVDVIHTAIEPAMRQGMAQATAGKEPTPDQKRIMDRFLERIGGFLRTEVSWAKLEPIQIKVYRESFEQFEIDGLIDFYRSPLGQSYVSKMPVATQKSMAETQIYMQQVMQNCKQLYKKC